MDSSREDQQRVNVDSISAWAHIRSSVQQAALSALEEQGIVNDRDAIVKDLESWIEQAFLSAKSNIRVNGRNFEDFDDENEADMEPFDEALDRQVWSLADNRLKWYKHVSDKRRTNPAIFEQDLFNKEREAMDRLATSDGDDDTGDDEEDIIPSSDDIFVERHSVIADGYHKTKALGRETEQVIMSQKERSERYEPVLNDVKSLKP